MKTMKAVINVQTLSVTEPKPVEFTHYLGERGWSLGSRQPNSHRGDKEVYYMGKCKFEGDMFFDYDDCGRICVFKGHLNSGTY
jgi:hypothetical protein